MNLESLLFLLPLVDAVDAPPSTAALPEPPAPYSLRAQDEPPPEYPTWSGTLSLGVTAARGNSETNQLTFDTEAERRGETDRTKLKAFWYYADQTEDGDTDVTQRRLGTTGQYDYFVSEKLYYLGNVGAEHDGPAELDLRYYAGAGVGYQWKEEEELSFSTEAGLSYLKESFEGSPDEDNVTLRLATDLGWQVTETTRFSQAAEAFPAVDDFDDVYAKIDNRVQLDVTEKMFAKIQYVLAFDHTPAAGSKQTDHLFVVGVGWTF